MKFCPQCGKELKDTQKFCGKCGKDLDIKKSKSNTEEDLPIAHSNETSNLKQNLSETSSVKKIGFKPKKIHFIILGIILLTISISFGTILTLKLSNTPSKMISKFQNAIIEKDTLTLSKLITCKDSRLEITEENVNSLLNLFESNPALINETVSKFTNQGIQIESFGTSKIESYDFIGLDIKKSNFLYSTYTINVSPIFITLNGPSKDIILNLNDTEMYKSTTDNFQEKIGPIMPGNYILKSNFESGEYKADYTENITLINPSEEYIFNILPGYTVPKFECNYNEATIFIDGFDTKIKVKDADSLGPVKEYAEIYAGFTNEKGTFKTNTTSISSYFNTATLNFDNNTFIEANISSNDSSIKDDIEAEIHALLDNYLYNFASAVTYGEFSRISEYLYPSSSLYDTQKNLINTLSKDGIIEEFVSSKYSNFKFDSSNNSGTISVEEIFKVGKSYGDLKEETYNWTYSFKYNPETKSFLLTNLS